MTDYTAISHADAARLLEDIGHDAASARAMLNEYLHECSRRVGLPVYQWGLDATDVDAIARDYEWVAHTRGESLDAARQRAARQAAWWTARAQTGPPAFVEHAQRQSELWATRSRAPEPFTITEAADPVEQAHRAVAAIAVATEDDIPPAHVVEHVEAMEDVR